MSEIALFGNPRKRRRRKTTAKRHRSHRKVRHMKVRKHHHVARRPKRRYRRAVKVSAGPLTVNPRRRKRRFRLHGYRHNPSPMNFIKQNVMPATVGAGGALGLDVLLGFASPYLPAIVSTGPMRPVVRLAGAIGLGMIATKVGGRKLGEQVAAGAITVTIYDVLKGIVKSVAPTLSLGEYEYPMMGYYSPGMQVGNEMGQYVNGMGEYVD